MRKILGTFIFLFLSVFSFATHQVGGYIAFKWLNGYTYQITIYDYENTYPPNVADRDGMRIYFGDGYTDSANRSNGRPNYLLPDDPIPNGEPLCNYDFGPGTPTPRNGARKLSIYQFVHTYTGPGHYLVHMDDQDRMAFINNITNSVSVDYYMYSVLTIPLIAPNDTNIHFINSPLITNAPVCQYGCVGQCYTYNPGAYIPDLATGSDDSIHYTLGRSLMAGPGNSFSETATGYYNPGATINPETGTLRWCPTSINDTGRWNFVILMVTYERIYESLGGVTQKVIIPLDTVELELEVIINSICSDPNVTSQDICVIAGENASITYTATVGNGDPLYITAAGQPFSESPSATLTGYLPPASTLHPVLNWATNCDEVRENPYEVVIRATEKVIQNGDSALYSAYGTSLITVVGPPPGNLKATVKGTTVCLQWDPSICPRVTGYNIYRAKGCINWQPDVCITGVPSGIGYTLIATNLGINDTTYCDNNNGAGLSPGGEYSYLVDASYPLPDGSLSLASNYACVLITLGVPIITNVSVTETNPVNGEMFVRWIKPFDDPGDLDTTHYPPPYKYVLKHALDMNGQSFSTIATIISLHYNSIIDTSFTDKGLNTQQNSYNYKLDFYSGPDSVFVGSSGAASSTYLRLQREDKSMNLGWSANVPWTNDTFYIYKEDPPPAPQVYNFLAKTTKTTYTDTALHNGSTYCYYVKSYSEYKGILNIPHPLFDSSETMCGTPEDTIAPCPPPLNVVAKCTLYEDSIIWTNPDRLCPEANKVVGYQIYYTPVEHGDMYIIATINNPNDTIFVNADLTSVAGCYAVLAIDSAGQTSPLNANTFCVDNCPDYRLPNVFSPNGDGTNDLFTPLEPYRYVKDIDINIYNRWGQVMFHTTNPSINWNGNVDNSGGPCPEGVYYYICVVNQIRVTGIVPITLKGFIQLIRTK